MSELRSFTFLKHDGAEATPVLELGEFPTLDEARTFAAKLLGDGPRYDAVEIWNAEGQQFVIRRDVPLD